MSNKITTCKVLNKLNETEVEELAVCTEWNDGKIKVIIVKGDTVLIGETLEKEFEANANSLGKELQQLVEETQDLLCGKTDKSVEFVLKDNEFFWKRKRIRLSPKINVECVSKNECLSTFILNLTNHFSTIRSDILELEKGNEILKRVQLQSNNKVNEITGYKVDLEVQLYKKFMLVLNSKKEKIRELKYKLNEFKNKKDPVYDAATEASEEECDDKKEEIKSSPKNKSTKKRNCTEESNFEMESKKKKSDVNSTSKELENVIELNGENDASASREVPPQKLKKKTNKLDCKDKNEPCASTSTNILSQNVTEDDDTPDFLNSSESECEVELQFDEDNIENAKETSAIAEEDSEEIF